MAVAKNASAIQFNGGNVLASSWPYGTDGRAALPLTHFTLWSEPIGGYVLTGSPFSLGIVLIRQRPVQFLAEALRLSHPHSDISALWRDFLPGGSGEYTLLGAYRALEAIIANGETLGANPSRGEVYVGLHRAETRSVVLSAALAVGGRTLNVDAAPTLEVGEFVRLPGAGGADDEIIRVTARISDAQFTVARGQPGFDGNSTTPALHNSGATGTILEGPSLDNELINAGSAFPESPASGQRFVFIERATGLTGSVASDGAAASIAEAGDYFIHNGTNWVRESRGTEPLGEFGSVGYGRVAISRNPLTIAGSATAYTDAPSFEANQDGWILGPL